MKIHDGPVCDYCDQPIKQSIVPAVMDDVISMRNECADHPAEPYRTIQEICGAPAISLGQMVGTYLQLYGEQWENGWIMPHTHQHYFHLRDGRVIVLVLESVDSVHLLWEQCPEKASACHHGMTAIEWAMHQTVEAFGVVSFN